MKSHSFHPWKSPAKSKTQLTLPTAAGGNHIVPFFSSCIASQLALKEICSSQYMPIVWSFRKKIYKCLAGPGE